MNNRRLHAATWVHKVEEWVYAMPAATCQGELFDMTHRAAPLEPGVMSISPPGSPRWTPSSPTTCLESFSSPAHDADLAETVQLTPWQCDEKRPCSACIRHDVKCSLLDNPPPAILQREQREQREREQRERESSVTTSSASPEGSKSSFSTTMDHVRSKPPTVRLVWSSRPGCDGHDESDSSVTRDAHCLTCPTSIPSVPSTLLSRA